MAKLPTVKQQNLAKNLVIQGLERRWETLRDMIVDAGYSISSANQEGYKLITNPKVQQEIAKLGFTMEAAKARVSEILLTGDDNNALKAAEFIAKTTGSFAPEKHLNVNIHKNILDEIKEDGDIIRNKELSE